MPPVAQAELGRTAAALAGKISAEIRDGRIPTRGFLPTERQLAQANAVDRKTVRRALKSLEAQGLVQTVRRRGCRVLPLANDPRRGCPLAYVPEDGRDAGSFAPFHAQLFELVRRAAGRRGWSLLAEASSGRAAAETLERVRAQRAFGVVLESADPALLAAVRDWGVPAVLVNAWAEGAGLDAVMQDGYHGGLLAARHLAARGCRRVAWFGPASRDAHALERLGGALAGLADAGLGLPAGRLVRSGNEELARRARALLSRRSRPDGVIALWRGCAVAVQAAAGELGLAVGRDFQMVGWCPEELYESDYRGAFGDGPVPPAVTWSIRTMAETALSRLAERRESPALPALLVKVPVSLKPGTGEAG